MLNDNDWLDCVINPAAQFVRPIGVFYVMNEAAENVQNIIPDI